MARAEEVERAPGGHQSAAYHAAAAKWLVVVEFVLDLALKEGRLRASDGCQMFEDLALSSPSAADAAFARRLAEQERVDPITPAPSAGIAAVEPSRPEEAASLDDRGIIGQVTRQHGPERKQPGAQHRVNDKLADTTRASTTAQTPEGDCRQREHEL